MPNLTALEKQVWDCWGRLDNCASPVKTIAAELDMVPADVAFIVYPVETPSGISSRPAGRATRRSMTA